MAVASPDAAKRKAEGGMRKIADGRKCLGGKMLTHLTQGCNNRDRHGIGRFETMTESLITMKSSRLAALFVAFSLIQPVSGAFAETQPQPQKAGFFLFGKKGKKSAQKAEVIAEAERGKVKEMVAYATANKPRGRIWCVPFARTVTGVAIRGNANTWWKKAEGVYERGHEPKVGAVMAFAASRAMPMGHVAVVSKVISEREVLIDQANWERNRITQDTLVVDVSKKGDWSVVRVANKGGSLGRTNPVSGFIYN